MTRRRGRKSAAMVVAVMVLLMQALFAQTFAFAEAADEVAAQTTLSGTISGEAELNAAGSPYLIEGNLVIEEGASLNIMPGTTIQLAPGASVEVNGSVNAESPDLKDILITSAQDNGGDAAVSSADYWNGITIGSSGSFNGIGVTVKYARKAFNVAGNLSLEASAIYYVSEYGVNVQTDASFSGNNLTIRYSDAAELPAVEIPSDDNEVENGDFEDGSLDHWTTGGCSVSASVYSAYSGKYGLKFNGSGSAKQKITIKKCKTYQVTAKVRIDKEIRKACNSGVTVTAVDKYGRVLGSGKLLNGSNTKIGEWNTVSFKFKSTSTSAYIVIQTVGRNKMYISADDFYVSLVRSNKTASAPEAAQNDGSLEGFSYYGCSTGTGGNNNGCTPGGYPGNYPGCYPGGYPGCKPGCDDDDDDDDNPGSGNPIPNENVTSALIITNGFCGLSECQIGDCRQAGILVLENGSLYATAVDVSNCGYGIFTKGIVNALMSNITDCVVGIYSMSALEVSFTEGNIKDSTQYAAYNTQTAHAIIATNVYWDAASGPSVYDSSAKTWSANGGKIMGLVEYSPVSASENNV